MRYGGGAFTSRTALGALATGLLLTAGASASIAKTTPAKPPRPAPCKAPATGFQSCLRVDYTMRADGSIGDARVLATVVGRADACPRRIPQRRVRITRHAETLGAARRAGRCRRGVTTWSATFAPRQTAAWDLRKGDTLRSGWRGVEHPATVTIGG